MEILELDELYDLQDNLDTMVEKRADVDLSSYENVENRLYAFHTEIHELANEIGFFKYWKLSHKMKTDRVLYELVDGVHFLLSIGLTKGYRYVVRSVEVFPLWEEYSMLDLFKEIRRNEVDSVGKYQLTFSLLLGVAVKCGFTMDDVRAGYTLKNQVNIARQEEGY